MAPAFFGDVSRWGISIKFTKNAIFRETNGGYEDVWRPTFSPDGSKWGYRYKNDGKYNININGKTYGGYDFAWDPTFSSDNSKWGFQYITGLKNYINIKEKIYCGYSLSGI